jgi:predicted dinucleotide-binding enzyme
VVSRLIEDSGFEPVDAGPLTSARYLEPLAFLWMEIALTLGSGKDIAIKLLRR